MRRPEAKVQLAAGSRAVGHSSRVRSAPAGRRVERLASAATRGSLGDRRLDRQGRSHSDHPGTRMGEEPHRRLAALRWNLEWKDLQEGNACGTVWGNGLSEKVSGTSSSSV